MRSVSTTRKDDYELDVTRLEFLDLETRATESDHSALRLWLRLLSCTMRIENEIRFRLRTEFDTTLARFDLMAQLDRCPQGLRMNELSRLLMVSGGNVTGVTDQLEREGLVVRLISRNDRRTCTVRLTPRGVKRFREMAVCHEQWVIELMDGLSSRDQRYMIEELAKLKAYIVYCGFGERNSIRRSPDGGGIR
jgi:DNA-binding MarR family transcriptional regulator